MVKETLTEIKNHFIDYFDINVLGFFKHPLEHPLTISILAGLSTWLGGEHIIVVTEVGAYLKTGGLFFTFIISAIAGIKAIINFIFWVKLKYQTIKEWEKHKKK